MDEAETDSRAWYPFSKQHTKFIILDLQASISKEQVCEVTSALLHTQKLVSLLPGPPRIPFIGLHVINGATGHIAQIPFGRIRGNFQSIYEKMDGITDLYMENKIGREESLISALREGHEYYQRFNKIQPVQHDIDLTIISCSQTSLINKTVQSFLSKLDEGSSRFQNVDIIQLSPGIKISIDDVFSIQSEQDDENTDEELSSPEIVNTNLIYFQSDDELRDHFIKWLQDSQTDRVKLELELSSLCTDNPSIGKADSQSLRIKLNIIEMVIPMQYLPFHDKHSLNLSTHYVKPSTTKADKYNTNIQVKPMKLIAVSLVKNNSGLLCYDTPIAVEPSFSWLMDWDELEKNSQTLVNLTTYLTEQNLGLICKQIIQTDHKGINKSEILYCLRPVRGMTIIQKVVSNDVLLYPISQNKPDRFNDNEDNGLQLAVREMMQKLPMKEDPVQNTEYSFINHISMSLLPKRYMTEKRKPTSENFTKNSNSQPIKRAYKSRQNGLKGVFVPSPHAVVQPMRKLTPCNQQTAKIGYNSCSFWKTTEKSSMGTSGPIYAECKWNTSSTSNDQMAHQNLTNQSAAQISETDDVYEFSDLPGILPDPPSYGTLTEQTTQKWISRDQSSAISSHLSEK